MRPLKPESSFSASMNDALLHGPDVPPEFVFTEKPGGYCFNFKTAVPPDNHEEDDLKLPFSGLPHSRKTGIFRKGYLHQIKGYASGIICVEAVHNNEGRA